MGDSDWQAVPTRQAPLETRLRRVSRYPLSVIELPLRQPSRYILYLSPN